MHPAENESNLSLFDKVRYLIRASISVYGQSMLWVSVGLAMSYTEMSTSGGPTVWEVMTYVWAGLAGMSMTNSIDANAWIKLEVIFTFLVRFMSTHVS